MTTKTDILRQFHSQISVTGHIIGVAAGSGMTTKYSVKGGADFILALSAGRFRQAGRPSLASYLSYANSNELVSDFATRELLSLIDEAPILFGLHATDPTIDLESYIAEIRMQGLAGIANFPTVGLIDGDFRRALEEDGIRYDREVEAIRIAHEQGLLTLAFVFDEMQTKDMIEAGADIICAHLGWNAGGALGAKKLRTIEESIAIAHRIFRVCRDLAPGRIRMIYGGPVKTPADAQYFYEQTDCQGFIGGSSFERIPSEKAILNTLQAFKNSDEVFGKNSDAADKAMMHDYITFIQNHIAQNYQQTITLNEMALLLHLSPPYLSSLFKRRLGCSFTEYLIRFRMNKAAELLRTTKMTVSEIAEDVGYPDSAQFSKIFKKYKGHAPRVYRSLAVSEPEAPAEATEAAQATDKAVATDEVRGKEAP